MHVLDIKHNFISNVWFDLVYNVNKIDIINHLKTICLEDANKKNKNGAQKSTVKLTFMKKY
jgi:hypothetical protein